MSLSQFEGAGLFVRGLDGMPLIELKTDRFPFTPLAPAQPGCAEVRDAYVGNG